MLRKKGKKDVLGLEGDGGRTRASANNRLVRSWDKKAPKKWEGEDDAIWLLKQAPPHKSKECQAPRSLPRKEWGGLSGGMARLRSVRESSGVRERLFTQTVNHEGEVAAVRRKGQKTGECAYIKRSHIPMLRKGKRGAH